MSFKSMPQQSDEDLRILEIVGKRCDAGSCPELVQVASAGKGGTVTEGYGIAEIVNGERVGPVFTLGDREAVGALIERVKAGAWDI